MPPCQDQAGHRHLQVTECQIGNMAYVDSDSMSVLEGGLCGEGGDEPHHPALLGTGELANVIVSGELLCLSSFSYIYLFICSLN